MSDYEDDFENEGSPQQKKPSLNRGSDLHGNFSN